MSEYQYYEFQAIDRPLSKADQADLRALSSRGQITGTSFVNEYQWGDFKGSPDALMARCFDLHLYLANWGTRRLMIRLPKRLVASEWIDQLRDGIDGVKVKDAGANLVLDVTRDDVDAGDWVEGGGQLGALAPLRADVLAGDMRLFYLIWLMAVDEEAVGEDDSEPLPGLGPMTGALEAFAEFFAIDPDLVAAAAERSAVEASASLPAAAGVISAMGDAAKDALLLRVFEGDPLVAAELRAAVRTASAPTGTVHARSVGDLRVRAASIAIEREGAAAVEAEKARLARVQLMVRRGDSVWRDIEAEIERRNYSAYDNAAKLLSGMREVAQAHNKSADFSKRLAAIRERHARKGQFLARIADLG